MTTFFAATTGIVQNDLKRVIAYSTCSQLGYMVFSCGLSQCMYSSISDSCRRKNSFERRCRSNFIHKKKLLAYMLALELVGQQKCKLTRSKKSIATFKIRKG